ncbi:hypothetical protein BS78_06G016900 [Paspalum vaginatum]|nr:hypothetical protein BS78_06G016900 [Paspalum vaginatum]KAJ1269944.1 hypothetical protein BS78_06G016900 [Paspalum vaginatum]
MGAAGVVAHAWNEWGIRSLVLLSFALQVSLLILAEFRRRIDSSVLRFSVWSAYMLADATAIYALGHMSVTSRSAEHQLMAFWAPLLLLHLGGQDNITAYAIEDNRLWLRHLQTLALQVAAAGYVLYESSIISHVSLLLSCATILMSLVGAAKYGERVWALMSAGSNPITGKNYRNLQPSTAAIESGYYLDPLISTGPAWDAEAYLLMAHRMLDVPMDLMRGPLGQDYTIYPFASNLRGEDLYQVVEMQLSLMHDVFYTKTAVIHSNLYGLCVHALTAAATASAFLLFHFHLRPPGGHGNNDRRTQQGQGPYPYSRVDVAITYVLLAGAVVLEVVSLLRAMLSSWTCPLLVRRSRDKYRTEEHKLLNHIARALTSLRRLIHAADWRRRYWSGSMGQHNLLRLGARSRASSIGKIARWMGMEDRWNTMAYSWRLPAPALVKDLLVKQVLRGEGVVSGGGGGADEAAGRSNNDSQPPEDARYPQLFDSRGRAELKRWGLYDGDIVYSLTWSLDERILVWHIATNVFLSWWRSEKKQHTSTNDDDDDKAEVVEALSNYMVFLLAADPYMLSPAASRSSYIEVCYGLTTRGPRYGSAEELAGVLRSYGDGLLEAARTGSTDNLHIKHGFRLDFSTQQHLRLMLQTGCKLGAKLISSDAAAGTMEVVAQVWVETLCYAAEQCSADSHAKQLSNGGELITVAALLLKYLKKRHFPTAGTRFNPQRWHRGGPFGSPSPQENNNPFSRAFP